MNMEGEFETHITVRDDRLDALRRWAVDHELSLLHIVLDRGLTPSQPMVTRRGRGGYDDQLRGAKELGAELERAGFSVTRIKIEAAVANEGVPQTDEEAAKKPAEYFEHHVKLVLPPGADLAWLEEIARAHGGHLSRNARRVRDDGNDERFMTQRCSGVGAVTARQNLDRLLSALGDGIVARVETELVVHDSNLDADAGWMSP